MSKNLKISLALIAAALIAVAAAALLTDDPAPEATGGARNDQLVRPDSHVLSEAEDGTVTFVEFLDFECEACRAAHPAVEELRATYGDRITFAVRHFPLHGNSEEAARAAEAAAEQGQFEEMYNRLFETQPQWGEQSESQRAVFFAIAEDLDLDMDAFEEVYDDPATIEKIARDKEDGLALGVTATPSFFLNGEQLEPSTYEDLLTKIDDALAT